MTYAKPGIPGLRGTEHVGFTVPDIEQATRFFVDVIGCELVYSLGPMSDPGDWMATHLNVDARAQVRDLRLFRCRHGVNFEVFEYEAPAQRREPPRNSDVGGHHLAFYVDDFERALTYLRRHDVKIVGEPTTRRDGPSAGMTWVYFLAPWGMQFELVSFPQGRAYEETASVRLWHPANPDQ
ncbi:MAG: putative lyase [Steroidobacteraceae bacterium]|jgi:catechol 2,3-dioxygenase-like lactoylglutathione lyase family enzyme|nr:putative lyase [Steroidobacteraceae bacterium]